MALVHEDEIAPLEGFYRHAYAAAALFFHQFGDFDDLDHVPAAAPQVAGVQVEAPRRDAGSGQFGQMLLAQALVGGDEQDVVQRFGVVVQELVIVEVEKQRFAAAGGHPVGQFGQVVLVKGASCGSTGRRRALRSCTKAFRSASSCARWLNRRSRKISV
jgi:hypothetical protein